MPREHVEFIQSFDIAEEPISSGPFSGTGRRVLSRDLENGEFTALLTFPPGWSSALDGLTRSFELFVLRGDISVGGRRLDEGFYAYVPSTEPERALSSEAGALAVAYAHEQGPGSGPLIVVDADLLPWIEPPVAVPPGIAVKFLRVDPATGEGTWLAAVVPGWLALQAEVHPIVEESFMLQGDILVGPPGGMTPGCYFWRPPNIEHGPMFSRAGAEFLTRSRGGAMTVEWYDVPTAAALVRDYAASLPVFPR